MDDTFVLGIIAAAVLLFFSSLGGNFAAARFTQLAAALGVCLMLLNSIYLYSSNMNIDLLRQISETAVSADFSAVNDIIANQTETLLAASGYPFSAVEAIYSSEYGLALYIRGSDAALERQIVSLLNEQFGKCSVRFC